MHAPLVVIGREAIQLSLQVETVPEEGLVEILAPKGSDEPLDERMRARREAGPTSIPQCRECEDSLANDETGIGGHDRS